jgi:hypothetical protein
MDIQTINAIPCSSLFASLPEARSQFNGGDFDVSFGDAMHTLVDDTAFLGMLDDAGLTEDELKNNDHPMANTVLNQVKVIHNRLDTLGSSILIDLEN